MKRHVAAVVLIITDQVLSGPFDAEKQRISTTGEHAFVPPNFEAGDQRGPCPGLNALANHNYLPHNGVANIQQFIIACFRWFGMGIEVAIILAVYGAIFDGNLERWSIGGETDLVQSLFSRPLGLSNSHNHYESDYSPFRGDLYLKGNAYKLQLEYFKQFYEMSNSTYDLAHLTKFRAARFQDSVSHNKYFFSGPFSGLLVNAAAYAFIYRLMANHSAQFPEGRLTRKELKAFFAMDEVNGSYVYREGHERFPENWYRRGFGDEYNQVSFLADVLAMVKEQPEFASVGGNMGEINSFSGIDLSDLTGGTYNLKKLAEGDNFACFVFQLTQILPGFVQEIFSEVLSVANTLLRQSTNSTRGIDCSKLMQFDPAAMERKLEQWPGFRRGIDNVV